MTSSDNRQWPYDGRSRYLSVEVAHWYSIKRAGTDPAGFRPSGFVWRIFNLCTPILCLRNKAMAFIPSAVLFWNLNVANFSSFFSVALHILLWTWLDRCKYVTVNVLLRVQQVYRDSKRRAVHVRQICCVYTPPTSCILSTFVIIKLSDWQFRMFLRYLFCVEWVCSLG